MEKGFKHCEAGPMVRSSYHADEQVNEAAKEKTVEKNSYNKNNINPKFIINFLLSDIA